MCIYIYLFVETDPPPPVGGTLGDVMLSILERTVLKYYKKHVKTLLRSI